MSEAKYDVILQKLAELKKLAEETDKKVGVLHAEKTGKMQAARKEEERKEAKMLADAEQRRKDKVQPKHDEEMIAHGVYPTGYREPGR